MFETIRSFFLSYRFFFFSFFLLVSDTYYRSTTQRKWSKFHLFNSHISPVKPPRNPPPLPTLFVLRTPPPPLLLSANIVCKCSLVAQHIHILVQQKSYVDCILSLYRPEEKSVCQRSKHPRIGVNDLRGETVLVHGRWQSLWQGPRLRTRKGYPRVRKALWSMFERR